MTEKMGGSDVSAGTQTFALEESNASKCYLYGYKWFSSATDSDMSLAIARFPKNEEEVKSNKGKLAMTFLKIRKPHGTLNNIEIVRLKDKLGTRQLPTAELVLRGTEARRVTDVGQGIKYISNMLNITRLHNAISAVASMRRVIALANDYKERRTAFGKLLTDH
jgi:alkylation response protein AidB-like acyl-CoA dehydrogenase